jgi:exosome complex RNA-binding protein Rrp42 (RNase PH superfamily)
MAAISGGERDWILEGVQVDVRNDGRKCLDFREAQLQVGFITSAAGSARVRVGGNDVIVGVKVSAWQQSHRSGPPRCAVQQVL